MFFYCGSSEWGIKGNFLHVCTKCDTDRGWWWQLLNVLGAGWGWPTVQLGSELQSPESAKHGSGGVLGREESVPYPAVIPHPGTFRNNLASFSVSPQVKKCAPGRSGPATSICPAIQMHPAYELPAVFSLHFQSGLSLKLKWVSCGQHYLWVFFCCFFFNPFVYFFNWSKVIVQCYVSFKCT